MVHRTPTGRGHDTACSRLFCFFSIVLLATNFITGCGGKNFASLRFGIESRGHYIEGVPFFRQSESTCGPAALASVLAFRGRQVNLEEITVKVYLPKLRGTLPMDMENYAREAGFKTESSAGTLEELKVDIRKGMPIICLLDLGFGFYQRPHYVTVIGFDDVNEVIIEHDGLKPNSVLTYEKFRTAWIRAGSWMLTIVPQTGDSHP
jgi:ABC-type bacteriocin/lantibiotic exporter with double-glycine peptidase domain